MPRRRFTSTVKRILSLVQGRPSVRRQIEKTEGIEKTEVAWAKAPGQRIRRVSSIEAPHLVAFEAAKFKKGDKYWIHSHRTGDCRPTFRDLTVIWDLVKSTDVRTAVISSIDKKGREIGRAHIKFPERLSKEAIFGLKNPQALGELAMYGPEILAMAWDIRIRYVPLKGYAFDSKTYSFVPKKKAKKKRKK